MTPPWPAVLPESINLTVWSLKFEFFFRSVDCIKCCHLFSFSCPWALAGRDHGGFYLLYALYTWDLIGSSCKPLVGFLQFFQHSKPTGIHLALFLAQNQRPPKKPGFLFGKRCRDSEAWNRLEGRLTVGSKSPFPSTITDEAGSTAAAWQWPGQHPFCVSIAWRVMQWLACFSWQLHAPWWRSSHE